MTGERLDRYLAMLFSWNEGAGLTAFKNRNEALLKGVKTAEAALPLLPESGEVLDVGSGGGFPAVPIVLKRPSLHFTLCEPAPLKAAFLRAAARELGLAMEVVELQASEFLAKSGSAFNAATVRGVKIRPPLLKALRRSMLPGSVLLVWTGAAQAVEYGAGMKRLGFAASPPTGLKDGSVLLCGTVPRGTVAK